MVLMVTVVKRKILPVILLVRTLNNQNVAINFMVAIIAKIGSIAPIVKTKMNIAMHSNYQIKKKKQKKRQKNLRTNEMNGSKNAILSSYTLYTHIEFVLCCEILSIFDKISQTEPFIHTEREPR
jgi:hypothetical protein